MVHDPSICPTDAQLLALYPVFAVAPYATGFNGHTLTITSLTVGLYLLTVDALPFPLQRELGVSVTELRDAMLALIAGTPHTKWIETPSSTDAIILTSLVNGRALPVQSNLGPGGTEMTLAETTPLAASDIIHQALQAAECLVHQWGSYTYEACMAAAVHWLKMWGQGQSTAPGPTGQVTGMTQGPFSVSFASSTMSSGSDGWWTSTPEGAKFLFLRMQLGTKSIRLRGGMGCSGGRGIRRGGTHAGRRGWN